MKIIRSIKEVAEGWYLALIVAVVLKDTRMGQLSFLRCRITAGKDCVKGLEIDFLVPPFVKEGTNFHRFLISALGAVDAGRDVDPQALVNKVAAIRVKKVRRRKREYANVVAIAPPERVEETGIGG